MCFTPTDGIKEANSGRDLPRLADLFAHTDDRRVLKSYRIDASLLVEPEFTKASEGRGRS